MIFNVCKTIDETVYGKKDQADPREIPKCPTTEPFEIESSVEKLVFWVDNPEYQGNLPWKITVTPRTPQDVNVTIGGN